MNKKTLVMTNVLDKKKITGEHYDKEEQASALIDMKMLDC